MITNEGLKRMLIAIKEVYGYDFTQYSQASFKRRVANFLEMKKITSGKLLCEMVLKDESLFEEFIQEVTVNVTEMFRDPGFYQSLCNNVFPRLATYPFIRIWIAGCSTGEEAYSLAILLKEHGLIERSRIYATDINQRSLKMASEGVFTLRYLKNYTMNYQKAGGRNSFSDYYIANYNAVLMDKSLTKNIVFSSHNLVNDRSFNEFHVILCRNVLIYFDQELQNNVINLFYNSLCQFGFLALGSKESILFMDKKKDFSEVDRKEKIFMKRLINEIKI